METRIVYVDESGDDGLKPTSSDYFLLSSICIKTEDWRKKAKCIAETRERLKALYNFPLSIEMHTKELMAGKNPYQNFRWTPDEKRQILFAIADLIVQLDLQLITAMVVKEEMPTNTSVLDLALHQLLAELEARCGGQWNYLIISDDGRVEAMRKSADRVSKKISTFNLIEEILDKKSIDSSFIQLCDYIACFEHLYWKCCLLGQPIPNRMLDTLSCNIIEKIMDMLSKRKHQPLRA